MPRQATMASTTLHTLADLLRLPDPDLPHELWHGDMRPVMPASHSHGVAVVRIGSVLDRYVDEHDLGAVSSDTGFILARDPDTVLCPDVAFVSNHRLPPGEIDSSFADYAPDLAVEVVSPSNRTGELKTKVRLYLDLGTDTVWVLHPNQRWLRIYSRVGGHEAPAVTLRGDDTLVDGGMALPGFSCRLADLFPRRRR
jgi:Uma2 family endonuclease